MQNKYGLLFVLCFFMSLGSFASQDGALITVKIDEAKISKMLADGAYQGGKKLAQEEVLRQKSSIRPVLIIKLCIIGGGVYTLYRLWRNIFATKSDFDDLSTVAQVKINNAESTIAQQLGEGITALEQSSIAQNSEIQKLEGLCNQVPDFQTAVINSLSLVDHSTREVREHTLRTLDSTCNDLESKIAPPLAGVQSIMEIVQQMGGRQNEMGPLLERLAARLAQVKDDQGTIEDLTAQVDALLAEQAEEAYQMNNINSMVDKFETGLEQLDKTIDETMLGLVKLGHGLGYQPPQQENSWQSKALALLQSGV